MLGDGVTLGWQYRPWRRPDGVVHEGDRSAVRRLCRPAGPVSRHGRSAASSGGQLAAFPKARRRDQVGRRDRNSLPRAGDDRHRPGHETGRTGVRARRARIERALGPPGLKAWAFDDSGTRCTPTLRGQRQGRERQWAQPSQHQRGKAMLPSRPDCGPSVGSSVGLAGQQWAKLGQLASCPSVTDLVDTGDLVGPIETRDRRSREGHLTASSRSTLRCSPEQRMPTGGCS